MRTLLTIFFILVSISFYGQERLVEAPNYKKIKRQIKKENSPNYYPKLMERYKRADMSMTIEEIRYLYYGFTFQKGYDPYKILKYKPKIRTLLNKRNRSTEELDSLLDNTKRHLKDHPFDIEILKVQVYVYKSMQKSKEAKNKLKKIEIIKKAVKSSGDGKTKKTAFHVIDLNHEYELLKVLGYKYAGRYRTLEKFEYLKVGPNPENIPGLYFNLSQGMEAINN